MTWPVEVRLCAVPDELLIKGTHNLREDLIQVELTGCPIPAPGTNHLIRYLENRSAAELPVLESSPAWPAAGRSAALECLSEWYNMPAYARIGHRIMPAIRKDTH